MYLPGFPIIGAATSPVPGLPGPRLTGVRSNEPGLMPTFEAKQWSVEVVEVGHISDKLWAQVLMADVTPPKRGVRKEASKSSNR